MGIVKKKANNLCGELLRKWRKTRHVSQLDLAIKSQTSQRHLSFVETGRAQAGREIILKISEALDLPLRARNDILLAAGYAPYFPERVLVALEMTAATKAIKRMLEHHEPYPAMVLDRTWNIVMRNEAAARIIHGCVQEDVLALMATLGNFNLLRLIFDTKGLRSHIRSWPQTSRALIARVRREAASYPGSPLETLLHDLTKSDEPPISDFEDSPLESTIPMAIEVDGKLHRLLTTITTFGTPQDVSLQELRIEMSFPADEATDRLLRGA